MADTPEARLAGIEAELKGINRLLTAIERDIETYAPNATTVAVNTSRLDDLAKKLDTVDAWKRELREFVADRVESLEKQILACSHKVGELGREIDDDRKEREKKEERAVETRRRDRITLAVALISAMALLLAAIIGILPLLISPG